MNTIINIAYWWSFIGLITLTLLYFAMPYILKSVFKDEDDK